MLYYSLCWSRLKNENQQKAGLTQTDINRKNLWDNTCQTDIL